MTDNLPIPEDIIKKETRGYNAIKVGFFKLKNSKLTKQMKGFFAKKKDTSRSKKA